VKEAGAEGFPRTAQLLAENADLRTRLDEAEETLRALSEGQVDAIVIGGAVYTLEGANAASNRLRGDALAQMQDGVVATDLEGRITYLNRAAEQLYGQAASTVLGKPLHALFHKRWLTGDDEAEAARATRERRFWRGQCVHLTSAGVEVRVESALSPLRDLDDEAIGMLEVIRDVGERERAQQALRDADRRKDEFLATLAHELRNPLAPIMNALAIMRSSREPNVHDRFLQMIERQATQLVHLVEDLLDVGRISQGKLHLRRETLDIASVVRSAGETCRPQIERHEHALSYRFPTERLLVDGDLTRLTQVFANILDNAAKYTPRGGRIDVVVTSDAGDVVVSVADTGIGVAPAQLASVFDMFTQIESASTKAQGGLGIGLALVRRLVGLHGGSVTAHSAGIGSGLTVVVRLPKLAAAAD
jgi:PAS domain S-box-containing protein